MEADKQETTHVLKGVNIGVFDMYTQFLDLETKSIAGIGGFYRSKPLQIQVDNTTVEVTIWNSLIYTALEYANPTQLSILGRLDMYIAELNESNFNTVDSVTQFDKVHKLVTGRYGKTKEQFQLQFMRKNVDEKCPEQYQAWADANGFTISTETNSKEKQLEYIVKACKSVLERKAAMVIAKPDDYQTDHFKLAPAAEPEAQNDVNNASQDNSKISEHTFICSNDGSFIIDGDNQGPPLKHMNTKKLAKKGLNKVKNDIGNAVEQMFGGGSEYGSDDDEEENKPKMTPEEQQKLLDELLSGPQKTLTNEFTVNVNNEEESKASAQGDVDSTTARMRVNFFGPEYLQTQAELRKLYKDLDMSRPEWMTDADDDSSKPDFECLAFFKLEFDLKPGAAELITPLLKAFESYEEMRKEMDRSLQRKSDMVLRHAFNIEEGKGCIMLILQTYNESNFGWNAMFNEQIHQALKNHNQGVEYRVAWHDNLEQVFKSEKPIADHACNGISVSIKTEMQRSLRKVIELEPKWKNFAKFLGSSMLSKLGGRIELNFSKAQLLGLPKVGEIAAMTLEEVFQGFLDTGVKDILDHDFGLDNVDQDKLVDEGIVRFQALSCLEHVIELLANLGSNVRATALIDGMVQIEAECSAKGLDKAAKLALLMSSIDHITETIEDQFDCGVFTKLNEEERED